MPYRPEEEVRYVVRPGDKAFTRPGYVNLARRSKKWTIIHDIKRKEYEVYGEGEYVGTYPEKKEDEMYMAIWRKDAEIQRDKERLARRAAELPHTPSTKAPTKRGVSRRTVLIGLGGLATLASIAGGSWLVLFPRPLYVYQGHSGIVRNIKWSPNATRIASASDDGTVQVWDATTGSNVLTYRGHSEGANSLTWSPDGKRIASTGYNDKTVQVWEAATGKRILTYRGHSIYLFTVAWSPDGKHIASAGGGNTVQVWNTITGHHILTYHGHANGKYAEISTVAWSPDSKRIASVGGDPSTMQVWDATTGKTIHHFDEVYNTMIWSPDGKRIAFAGNNGVQIADATTWSSLFTYSGHKQGVFGFSWSPDGKRIASIDDNSLQVWNAANGDNIYTYRGKFDAAVRWSPDGKFIASIAGPTSYKQNLFTVLSGYPDLTVEVWKAP